MQLNEIASQRLKYDRYAITEKMKMLVLTGYLGNKLNIPAQRKAHLSNVRMCVCNTA